MSDNTETAPAEKSTPWRDKATNALRRNAEFLEVVFMTPELKLTPANVEAARKVKADLDALVKALSTKLAALPDNFIPAGIRNRDGFAVGDRVQIKPQFRAIFPMGDKVGVVAAVRTAGEGRGRGTVKFVDVKLGQNVQTFRQTDLQAAA